MTLDYAQFVGLQAADDQVRQAIDFARKVYGAAGLTYGLPYHVDPKTLEVTLPQPEPPPAEEPEAT